MNLTKRQRIRIAQDIINHRSESHEISNEPYEWDDIEEDHAYLQDLDDDELVSHWNVVGEWLCSIGSEYPSFITAWEETSTEFENPGEWQLDKLLDDGDIDYGYNYPVYDTPYRV